MNQLVEFIRRERNALVGYVRRRIDDAGDQDAEDIVQDVIVNLFNRADPTVPVQYLASYFYRALQNAITDRLRKRRQTVALSDTVMASGEDPLQEVEKGEMLDLVFEAMDKLTAGEKAIILATEFEGRSFKDLAEEWDVPLGTLLARKSRALDKIRKQLTGQFNHS